MDETTRAQFEIALARLLDGEPEPGDGEWLATLLRENPPAAREVGGLLALDDLLRQRAQSDSAAFADAVRSRLAEARPDEAFVERVTRSIAPPPKTFPWRWALATAALFVALFWVVKLIPHRGGETPIPGSPASVALLAQVTGAEWHGAAPQPGQALAPGWLRLRAGAVEIEFSRGARVLLEGPAEFELLSDNAGFLRRGKLRASVPPAAHGFTIRGAGFSAVDRGTEFGCIVPETGAAEVHVFAGMVDLDVAGVAVRTLARAEAMRVFAGKGEAIPAQAELFLSDDEFARRAAGAANARRAVWRQASAELSARPGVVVHYDFEQARGSARMLPNLVRGSEVSASIIGCEPAPGRWPDKGALEFKRAEDRVRLTIPGEMQSLTLLAWVRVDALPNPQSALLMGEAERPGEVHWYLNDKGHLGFAIIAPDGRWRMLHTEPLLKPALLGKWVFLATTFDGTTRTATHYLNGQVVASRRLDAAGPLRLRTVELGNWGVRPGRPLRASSAHAREPRYFARNLHGRMDEFALFSTPLPAPEILRLYENGQPDAPPSASE